MPPRASHTIKPPERCPYCDAPRPVKKGSRKKQLEAVQLWQCRNLKCHRVFTPDPRSLRHKTYPIKLILDGITLYNLGHSLDDTVALLAKRYSHHPSRSSLARWIDQHPDFTTYRRLREQAKRLVPRLTPRQTIRTIKLYHRQVYEFGYHRAKLALLQIPAPRGAHPKTDLSRLTAPVAAFLASVPTTCPHSLFTKEDTSRGSQLPADFIDFDKLIVVEKQNAATEAAALILPTVGSNFQRHPKLQKFMLANDSATVAVEIPVWLTEEEIASLEHEHDIELVPKVTLPWQNIHTPRTFTGHLDFLQIRNGSVHILDYKPDARTNKPFAQLTIYALALTRRIPGFNLFDIKCAFFNENVYNEFFPRTVLKHRAH